MSDSEKKTNCVSSCFNEFKPLQPWFKVEEEETQRVLDIPRSFCPCTTFDIVAKCLAFGYHVSTLVFTLIKTDDVAFFWAFFTNVALGLTVVYATISVLNSFFPVQQPEGPVVQARIKFTWLFFVLSIFGEAMASILFWVLVFDGDSASYADIAPHGIVFAVLLVEGFFVNRIPLRWMHFWSCLALTLAYIIWSIIHGPLVLDLGNPTTEDNDPDTNDDAIYADLSWDEDDIGSTVVLVCIVYFIVTPIIYALLRAASISTMLCCWSGDRRRYIDDSPYNDNGADEENPKVDDPSIVDMYVDDTTTGHESHYDEQEGEGGNAVTY